MSKNRRKRQIRNRIIAFIMAVAMVFTVVKVNDKKKEAKAGSGVADTTYTDRSYINTLINDRIDLYLNDDAAQVFNFYLQNNQIDFSLPEVLEREQIIYVYLDGEIAAETVDADVVDGKDYISYNVTNSFSWADTSNFNKDNTSTASKNLILHRTYEEPDETKKGELTPEQINVLKSGFEDSWYGKKYLDESYNRTILEFIYNVSTGESCTINNNGVADIWEGGEHDGGIYYGYNRYTIFEKVDSKEETDYDKYTADKEVDSAQLASYVQTKGLKTADEVNTVLNDNVGKTYCIVPVYYTMAVPGDDTTGTNYTYFPDFDSAKEIVAKAPEISAVTVNETALSSSDSNIFTTDITSISATVTHTTNDGLNVSVERKNGDTWSNAVALTTSSTSSPYTYTYSTESTMFTEGKGDYRIAVGYAGNNTIYSDSFTVIYDKTGPTIDIDHVVVGQVGNSDTSILKNDTAVTLTVPITDAASGVKEDTLSLAFGDKTYTCTSNTDDNYVFTILAEDLSTIIDGVPREYTIDVDDVAGNHATQATGSLQFEDTKAPTIGTVEASQIREETTYHTGLYASEGFTIGFTAEEATSGVTSFSVTLKNGEFLIFSKEYSGSDNNIESNGSGTYTCTTGNIDLKTELGEDSEYYKAILDGHDITYEITATDGNNNTTTDTEIATGAIDFSDISNPTVSELKITQGDETITPSSNNDFTTAISATELFTFGFTAVDETAQVDTSKCSLTLSDGTNSSSETITGVTETSDEYVADIALEDGLLATAKAGIPVNYTLIVSDSEDNTTTITGTIAFRDVTPPVVNNVTVTQNNVAVTKVDVDDEFVVGFDVYDTHIANVTIKIGSQEIDASKIEADGSLNDVTYGVGRHYNATVKLTAESDITNAKTFAKISYKITATDESTLPETNVTLNGFIEVIDEIPPVISNLEVKQGGKKLVDNVTDAEKEINAIDADDAFEVSFELTDAGSGINTSPSGENVFLFKVGTIYYAYSADSVSKEEIEGGYRYTISDITLDNPSDDYYLAHKGAVLDYDVKAFDNDGNTSSIGSGKYIKFKDEMSPEIKSVNVKQGDTTTTIAVTGDSSHKLYADNEFQISFMASDSNLDSVDVRFKCPWGEGYLENLDYTKNKLSYNEETGVYTLSVKLKGLDPGSYHSSAIHGNTLEFIITATDSILGNGPTTFLGKMPFYDQTKPVISNVGILQNQDSDVDLEVYETDFDKLTIKKDVTVKFAISDDGQFAKGTGVNKDTIVVSLTGGSEGSLINKTYSGENIVALTGDDLGKYTVTIPASDLANAAPDVEYDLAINASDKENPANAAVEVIKSALLFYDETATITITPTFIVKDTQINEHDYADYTSAYTGDDKVQFDVSIESEVEITDAKITVSDGYSIDESITSTTNTTTGIHTYSFTATKTTDSAIKNIASGTYSFTVNTENIFGSSYSKTTGLYYIDRTKPVYSSTDSGVFKDDEHTAKYVIETDGWVTEAYIYITEVTDDNGTANSGMADNVVPTVSNMTLVTGGHSVSEAGVHSFLYKVDCDTTKGLNGTDVSFTVTDKVGNISDSFTAKILLDDEKPTVAENSFKVGDEVVGTGAFYKTTDVVVSAKIEDKIHVHQVIFKCTEMPDDQDDTTPSATGYVFTNNPAVKQVKSDTWSLNLAKIVSGNDTDATLVEGKYVVTVEAIDLAGNLLATPLTVTIYIDKTDPIADINARVLTDPKSSGTHGDAVKASYETGYEARDYDYYKYAKENKTLTFTVVDDNVVADKIIVKDNGDEIQNTDLGWRYDATTKTWTGSYEFSAGKHSVTIAATDKAGRPANVRETQKVEFTIDKKAPTSSISLDGKVKGTNTAATHYIYDATVRVNLPALADAEGNLDKEDVYLYWKYAPLGSTSFSNKDPRQVTINGTTPEDLTFTDDGEYMVWVQAIDFAGNTFNSDPVYFMIDKVDPDIDVKVDTTATKNKFTTEYNHKGTHYDTTYTYSQFYNKDVELTLKVFDYNKDTITVTDNGEEIDANFTGSNGEYTAKIKVSEEGKHKIVVKATDTANGNGTSTAVEFTIDRTDPELGITLNGTADPENNQRINGTATIGFTLNDKHNDEDDVKLTYTFTPNEGDGENGIVENFKNRTFKEQGEYSVTIKAVDKAGNSTTRHLSFVIDTTVPDIDISSISGTAAKADKFGADYKHQGSHYSTSYHYGLYYNSDVKLTVKVFDYDISGAGAITVTDNDTVLSDVIFNKNSDNEYTATFTISKPEDGIEKESHDIKITAYDKVGETHLGSNEIKFTIDTGVPDIALFVNEEEAENNQRVKGKAELSYTLKDANKDITDVKLTGTFTPAGSSKPVSINEDLFDSDGKAITSRTFPNKSNGEGDGTYKVTVTSIDKAGNKNSKTTTFVIDTTKPEVYAEVTSEAPKQGRFNTTYTPAASNTLYTSEYTYGKFYNDSVTVDISVFDYDLNVNTYSVIDYWEGYEDGKKIITPEFTAAGDGVYTATVTIPKADVGTHKLTASATDIAGNTGRSTDIEFTIDTTPADLTATINGEPTPVMVRINGDAKVGYEISDSQHNEDLDDIKLEYAIIPAGGELQDKITEELDRNTTKTFTENGAYYIRITSVDKAGNESKSSASFVIDKSTPEINVEFVAGKAEKAEKFKYTYKPAVEGHFTTKNNGYDYGIFYYMDVTLRFTVFDYDLNVNTYSVIDYWEGYEDGKKIITPEFTAAGNYEYTAEVTIPKSEEGIHEIIAYATDIAGHEGSSTPIIFAIDTTNPVLDIFINGKEPVEDQRIDGKAVLSYNLTDNKNVDWTDISFSCTFTPADGSGKITNIEDLFDNATRTFPNAELDEGDGKYEITVVAYDCAGNPVKKSTSFVIDTKTPELNLDVLTAKPAKFDTFKRTYKPAVEGYFTTEKNGYEYGQYYKDDVKVRISVFDYDPKNTVVYDNGEEVEATFTRQGRGLYYADIVLSEEGTHVIKAETVDWAGNTGKSSEVSFIIDKTAPELTTTLDSVAYTSMDAFLAKNAVVGIKVKDANKDAADILRDYVIMPSDGSAKITDSSYVSEEQEVYKQDAYHTVTYTVTDRAGNASKATIGFTVDKTKPQSDIKITTKAPAKIDKYHNTYSNTGGHFDTTYTYGQYYNESVSMDMSVFDYNVSKIVVTDNDEVIPVTFVSRGDERVAAGITVTDEGEHVVKITVTDKSDNTKVSNSVSFVIDKSIPGLSATLNGSGNITDQYLNVDASVFLSVSDINEDEDDVTRIVKLTRPSASSETSTEKGALEGTVTYGTEADYEVTYTAIDRAGNESSPVTLTFRVDKTAPQLNISGITRDATSTDDVTITYSMIEGFYWDINSAGIKIFKKVDGGNDVLIDTVDFRTSGATSTLSEVFKEDGEYRFEFTAEDKTGNKANETFRFILDENAPIVIIKGVDGSLTDQDVSFGVQIDEIFFLGNNIKIEGTRKTLDDPDGKAIEFDDYSKLTRTSSANFEQIFTEDGIYNIKVVSKDSAGNETVQTVQFTIDKTKPLIKDLEKLADEKDYASYVEAVENNDPNAKKLIPIFNSFEFDYDADDIVTDLTTVTYKLYMDGVLYDGLSDVADGFHELRVTAEDEVGNTAERTFYFMLDTVKPGIIVTGVEEGDNLQQSTTITVTLQLSEDTLKSVKLNDEPVAVVDNSATVEVSKKGDYKLVIEAFDDAGNVSEMTIEFEYGKVSSLLWLLIAAGAALIIGATTFFIILAKKRKKRQ